MADKKTYEFIVSTEDLNAYGYRVLTDGIDISQYMRNPVVLYMHQRAWDDPKAVIGRCVDLKKKDGKLVAYIEFDTEDEFAASVAGKVERGFLKMTSIGFEKVEFSESPEHLLPGQTRSTVTKSKLKEISIVDIGANDGAVRLYLSDNRQLELAELPTITKKGKSMDYQKMYEDLKNGLLLAHGLTSATDAEIIELAKKNKGELAALSGELEKIKSDVQAERDAEAEKLTGQLVEKGLLPAHLKSAQLAHFKSDFDEAKKAAEATLAEADEKNDEVEGGMVDEVKSFLSGLGKGNSAATDAKKDYAWYERNNPDYLLKLKKENPKAFDKLFNAHFDTV